MASINSKITVELSEEDRQRLDALREAMGRNTGSFDLDTSRQFWVFGGKFYYPSGGMDDFIGSYGTFANAVFAATGSGCEWWEVLDAKKGVIEAKSDPELY